MNLENTELDDFKKLTLNIQESLKAKGCDVKLSYVREATSEAFGGRNYRSLFAALKMLKNEKIRTKHGQISPSDWASIIQGETVNSASAEVSSFIWRCAYAAAMGMKFLGETISRESIIRHIRERNERLVIRVCERQLSLISAKETNSQHVENWRQTVKERAEQLCKNQRVSGGKKKSELHAHASALTWFIGQLEPKQIHKAVCLVVENFSIDPSHYSKLISSLHASKK